MSFWIHPLDAQFIRENATARSVSNSYIVQEAIEFYRQVVDQEIKRIEREERAAKRTALPDAPVEF